MISAMDINEKEGKIYDEEIKKIPKFKSEED